MTMQKITKGKSPKQLRWLAVSLIFAFASAFAQTWQPLGPAPIQSNGGGNVDNIDVDDPASGAIHGVAAHPTDPDTVYIAAVNGGIWKTTNATSASPTWIQQTDGQLSLSASDVAFDPTDGSNQTLIAGFGRFSSFASRGGARNGVIRTTDGGATWVQVGTPMIGRNISKVVARGNTLLASVDVADSFTCGSGGNVGIWRSTNGGSSWSLVTSGLIGGSADALAEDPTNNAVLYASMTDLGNVCGTGDGIFRSADTGATWSKVSDATMDGLIFDQNTSGNHFEIAVGPTGTVFVAIIPADTRRLAGVFYSTDSGANWTRMDVPETDSGAGIHPGGQGNLHSSLAADPNDPDIVYIGGDRQPRTNNDAGGFPNAIGAFSFSGRLFRGDINESFGSEWTPITHVGTSNGSAPHPDSRDMAFDANGALLQTDDGGIYRRTSPLTGSGQWVDMNGDLQVTEQHSGIFDINSQIAVSGNQDNGTTRQQTFANQIWRTFQGGDGGDVAVDELILAGVNRSVRYASSQNFGGARRLIYDQNNGFFGSTTLALNVLSGAALSAQFTTPIAVNQVAGGRLIIGGGNAAYESLDQGDTITQLTPAVPVRSGGRRTIAYGSAGNTELLYVIGSDGNLYQRAASGGGLNCVFTCSSGEDLEAVVLDPTNAAQAFVIDDNTVSRTTNTAASFSDVTGNLITSFSPGQLRTLQFMERPGGDALAVGTNRGVYIAEAASGYSSWAEAATGMPSSPVFDLAYDPAQDRLVAFTLGRGAFAASLGGAANQAPSAGADSASTTTGGTVTVLDSGQASLLFNDSDPEGDNLTLQTAAVSGPASGSVTLNANGTFSYTHNGNGVNSDSFTYRVCDDGTPSACDDAAVSITINQPPMAVDDSATVAISGTVTTLDSGQTSLLFNDDDPNGDSLTLQTAAVSGPASGSVTLNANGTFSYSHNGNAATSDAVIYRVCDDASPSLCDDATLSITITAAPNQSPQAVNDEISTTNGGVVAVLDSGQASLLFNDTDPDGDNLTLQTTPISGPASGSLSLNANGTFSYTHDGTFTSSDSFTYRVCDDGNPSACDDAVVAISIDLGDALCSAPAAVIPDPGAVTDVINVTAADVLTDMNVYLDISHTFVGDLTATLTHQQTGTSVQLLDRPGRPQNDPGFGCDGENVQASFDDSASQAAEDQCESSAPAIVGSVSPIGSLSDFNGEGYQGDWSLEVTDDEGVFAGTLQRWCLAPALSSTPNLAPNPANDGLTLAEGGTSTSLDGGATSVLANDSDPEGDNLVVTTTPVTPPANAASFTLNSNGSFSYTHNGGETSADLFVYEVCDDGIPTQCAQAQVDITVTEVNDPVSATDDTLADIDEDSPPRTINVADLLANDSAGAGEDSQSLSVSAVQNPTGGTVAISGSTITFTLTPQFNGAAGFDYTATDDGSTDSAPDPLSDSARVSFGILPINDAPSPADDAITVASGDTANVLVGGATSLLANDSDPDGDEVSVQGLPPVPPANGQLTLNSDGSFEYINDGLGGASDSFDYQVCDDGSPSLCSDATVTITVTTDNQPPVAQDDQFTLEVDQQLSATVAGNDSDPENDSLSFSVITPPQNGQLMLEADGSFVYTPDPGFTGVDGFTYDLTDGTSTVQASVILRVGNLVFMDSFED